MKKFLPLLLMLFFAVFNIHAQQQQAPEQPLLIALKDGSVIYPETIKPGTMPLLKPYLRIDSQYKLPAEEVKYYKDGTSYYFWAEVNEAGAGDLLTLNSKGNITTYLSNSSAKSVVNPYAEKATAAKPDYFQVNNGPIRKINCENLSNALTANQISVQKLQEAKRLQRTSKVCLIAGGSLVAAGLVHSYTLNRNNSKPPMIETGLGLDTRISPLLLLGAVTLTIPLANRIPAERKIEEAIAAYNK